MRTHARHASKDRDWFKANRGRYDEFLLGPARELAASLERFGKPRFFRPYNNVRFRPGLPLKEHLGVAIDYTAAGGSNFELSLDGLLVAAGLHHPATDQLERFRAAIDYDRRSSAFERTVMSAEAGGLKLAQPPIKRAPRGHGVDHPQIEWLRLRNLTISHRHRIDSWLHEPICRMPTWNLAIYQRRARNQADLPAGARCREATAVRSRRQASRGRAARTSPPAVHNTNTETALRLAERRFRDLLWMRQPAAGDGSRLYVSAATPPAARFRRPAGYGLSVPANGTRTTKLGALGPPPERIARSAAGCHADGSRATGLETA